MSPSTLTPPALDAADLDQLVAGLVVIPASIWRMTGPHGPGSVHRPAADGVFVHHSVTPTTDDPCADARKVESVGLDRFGRLSYSWLFHPSGVVLAGQETWRGAHTEGRNSTSLGFCALGDWTQDHEPAEHSAVLRAMMGMAVTLLRFGWLTPSSPVRPHRAIKATACPGGLAVSAPRFVSLALRAEGARS